MPFDNREEDILFDAPALQVFQNALVCHARLNQTIQRNVHVSTNTLMVLVLQRYEGCPMGVVQRILVEPSLDSVSSELLQ